MCLFVCLSCNVFVVSIFYYERSKSISLVVPFNSERRTIFFFFFNFFVCFFLFVCSFVFRGLRVIGINFHL